MNFKIKKLKISLLNISRYFLIILVLIVSISLINGCSIYTNGDVNEKINAVDEKQQEQTQQELQKSIQLTQKPQQTQQQSEKGVIYASPISNTGQSLSLSPLSGYEKIFVKYGYHTYGSNNQSEYDSVMGVINEIKAKVDNEFATGQNKNWVLIQKYLNGTSANEDKLAVEKYFSDFLTIPKEKLENLMKAYKTSSEVYGIFQASRSNNGQSAYTILLQGNGNPNASAYSMQAVYDCYGYNTRIRYSSNYAWCEVEINNKWYVTDSGLTYNPSYKGGGLGTLIPETFSNQY